MHFQCMASSCGRHTTTRLKSTLSSTAEDVDTCMFGIAESFAQSAQGRLLSSHRAVALFLTRLIDSLPAFSREVSHFSLGASVDTHRRCGYRRRCWYRRGMDLCNNYRRDRKTSTGIF